MVQTFRIFEVRYLQLCGRRTTESTMEKRAEDPLKILRGTRVIC